MTDALTTDVAISGGNFAGLAIALGLSKALHGGLRITVIAPSFATPPADIRAVALSASSKNVLDALGVWSKVAPHAQEVTEIVISDSDLSDAVRPPLLSYDTVLPSGEPSMWIVPNAALSDALLEGTRSAVGVTLLSGRKVSALATTPNDATLTLDTQEAVTARFAVAADGRRSTLRNAAGITTVGWDYGQHGIVAIIKASEPHHGRATQNFLPGGPFAMLPLPGNRICITWSEQSVDAERILATDSANVLSEIERRASHGYGQLTLESGPQSWPLDLHLARAYVANRVALAGDAAHGVHPIAGQGLNLGLRDVAALVEVIADAARLGLDIGHGTVLERYQSWRRFDSFASTAAFDTLNRMFSRSSQLARTARSAGLGFVDRAPLLKQMIVAEAAGLSGDLPKLLRGELP